MALRSAGHLLSGLLPGAGLLARSQLRFALRHPVGAAAAFVGIALATMTVVAVHLVGQSIRHSLAADAAPAPVGGHTHVLSRSDLSEADYFALRGRWRQAAAGGAEAAADLARIVEVVPVIEGYVPVDGAPRRIVGFDPVAGGAGPTPGRGTGLETPADPGLRRFLTSDVVVASPAVARAIAGAGGQVAGVVVEVVEAEGFETLLADLPTAQRLLGREGQLDAVRVRVADARPLRWLDALLPGIAAAMPAYGDPQIDGFTVMAEHRWNPARRFADSVLFNLGILSMLSLLMAAFLATQASYSNAARRRLEVERLVAIGASYRTLRSLAAAEGLLVGALATGVGIYLGLAVARWLAGAPPGALAPQIELGAAVVWKSLVCGLAVAALAPLLATRPPRAEFRRRRGLLGVLALAAVALCLVLDELGATFVALALAAFLHTGHVVPLTARAGQAVASLWARGRVAARANLRTVSARAGEISLALGALSVAVAVAIGMGLMVESLRRAFDVMLDQRLQPGVYLSLAEDSADVVDIDWIRGIPGVIEARRYGELTGSSERGPLRLEFAAIDAAEAARYGHRAPVLDGGLLNEVGARLFGVSVGERLAVSAAGRRFEVAVDHVFPDFGAPGPRLILSTTHASASGGAVAWRRAAVFAAPPQLAAVAAVLADRYKNAEVRDQREIRAIADAVFDRSFTVSRSLTWVALAVAVIGLYAALTALQAGRRREFTLLSAIGYSRFGIWRLAMVQTALLGAVAAVAAVPFGIVIAWLLCRFVNPQAFGWAIELRLDLWRVGTPVLLGIGGALLAGALPAYRALFRSDAPA